MPIAKSIHADCPRAGRSCREGPGRCIALWLLAVPLWAFLGTARHEFSHALVAAAQGAEIHQIRLFPVIEPGAGLSGLLWGYVSWSGGQTTWLAIAAPYFGGLILFSVFVLLCRLVPGMPRWLWINGFVLCMVSPLLDTTWNYSKVFWQAGGDVNVLASAFPGLALHICYVATLAWFYAGTWMVLRSYEGGALCRVWRGKGDAKFQT